MIMDLVKNEPAPSKRSLSSRVVKVSAACGVEAWLVEDHARPIVALSFNFKGGEYLDPDGKAGATRLMASLLMEGTPSLPEAAFRLELANSAIHLTTGSSRDAVTGSILTLARQAPRAAELLDVALTSAAFSKEAMRKGLGMIVSSLSTAKQNPDTIAQNAFMMRALRGHPYGVGQDQIIREISTVSREELLDVRARVLARANLRVGVAGAITETELCALLDRAFGGLPLGEPMMIQPCSLSGVGEMIEERLPSPQTAVSFGRQSIPFNDPDIASASVLLYAFGGGFSSRLMTELREKRGLCYGVVARSMTSSGMDLWTGSLQTPNETAAEAISLIKHEVHQLLHAGLSGAEIDAAKAFIIGSTKMQPQSNQSIASTLTELQVKGREPSWLDERYERLAAVSQESVAGVIPRIFGDGELLVTTAGGSAS